MNNRKLQRRARILALQALYAEEQQILSQRNNSQHEQRSLNDVLKFSWLDREASQEELFMARALVQGIRQNLEKIDHLIAEYLENWTIDRLLIIDRLILLLGIYMLEYLLDTPSRVIIDECIELCHCFSSKDSYRLINGILHKVAKELRQINSCDEN